MNQPTITCVGDKFSPCLLVLVALVFVVSRQKQQVGIGFACLIIPLMNLWRFQRNLKPTSHQYISFPNPFPCHQCNPIPFHPSSPCLQYQIDIHSSSHQQKNIIVIWRRNVFCVLCLMYLQVVLYNLFCIILCFWRRGILPILVSSFDNPSTFSSSTTFYSSTRGISPCTFSYFSP